MERKFKVGDLIKGKKNGYGITNEHMTLAQVVSVPDDYIMHIKCLKFDDSYRTSTIFPVRNSPMDFELVSTQDNPKIEIYVDGEDVIAKNTVTGKIGKATCHPDDAFDFAIGAKLAFERLMYEPKFKKGDIIELLEEHGSIPKGTRGEFVKYLDSMNIYLIDFKFEYDDSTYTCNGLLSRPTGRLVSECFLKKVDA